MNFLSTPSPALAVVTLALYVGILALHLFWVRPHFWRPALHALSRPAALFVVIVAVLAVPATLQAMSVLNQFLKVPYPQGVWEDILGVLTLAILLPHLLLSMALDMVMPTNAAMLCTFIFFMALASCLLLDTISAWVLWRGRIQLRLSA